VQVIYTPNTENWKSILTLRDTSALPYKLLVKHPTCGIKDSVSCQSYAKEWET